MWSKSQAQSNSVGVQKMDSQNALKNRCLHTITLVGAKHFNSTQTVA